MLQDEKATQFVSSFRYSLQKNYPEIFEQKENIEVLHEKK